MTEFSVEPVSWQQAEGELRAVRTRVFLEEQAVPEELEWDGEDPTAWHLLARNARGEAIGTTRVLPSGQIGRMAVLVDWRSRGVGRLLLQQAVKWALSRQSPSIFLHAQTHALGFYEKVGFVASGPEFLDAGIPHRTMTLPCRA